MVPASTLAVGFVDFTISLAILAVLMVWYQFAPDIRILATPLFVLLALTASLGAGLWIAALTVKYRDFRFIAPFVVQIGFFLCPLGYSSDKFPGIWRLVYSLNPMVGAIDGFRWAAFAARFRSTGRGCSSRSSPASSSHHRGPLFSQHGKVVCRHDLDL